MRIFSKLLCLAVLCAAGMLAADISGKWKGQAETPNGTIERTFDFKVDGNKLTGESNSEMMGRSVIENGKVEGDSVSFTLTVRFQDNEMKINYAGKITGDTINLTAAGINDMKIEYKIKRAS